MMRLPGQSHLAVESMMRFKLMALKLKAQSFQLLMKIRILTQSKVFQFGLFIEPGHIYCNFISDYFAWLLLFPLRTVKITEPCITPFQSRLANPTLRRLVWIPRFLTRMFCHFSLQENSGFRYISHTQMEEEEEEEESVIQVVVVEFSGLFLPSRKTIEFDEHCLKLLVLVLMFLLAVNAKT